MLVTLSTLKKQNMRASVRMHIVQVPVQPDARSLTKYAGARLRLAL